MFTLFTTILSFNFLFAFEGTFQATGEFDTIQEKRIEVIDSRSTKQMQKLESLKKKGFHCGKVGHFYKCKQFSENPSLDPSIKAFSKRQIFEFGPMLSKEIIADGDDLLQYKAEQRITVDGVEYEEALYTETSRIKKIQIGLEKNQGSIYVIVSKDQIYELQKYKKTNSRFSWVEYMTGFYYSN